MELPDLQLSKPEFQTSIYRVGIKNLKVPIFISQKNGGQQHSVADVSVYVSLDKESKGTHMSRLAIAVQKFLNQQLNKNLLITIAKYIKNKCETNDVQIIYNFPYFIEMISPVSKEPGIIHCNVSFNLTLNKNNEIIFKIKTITTSTSLCPCSKEISKNGAHNQRSEIKILTIPSNDYFMWIEDLFELSNQCSSCQIYSVLKRVDEKYVTEKAYENPCFVEDIIRKLNNSLIKLPLDYFKIEVENFESIHIHNAYASIIGSGYNSVKEK